VNLADTLVDDYDVIDLLNTLSRLSCDLFEATDAGILLVAADGSLSVAAASTERSRLISLIQVGADEGPCLEAYRTGQVVEVHGWAAVYARWPRFAPLASERGYESVLAVPLRLREERIGSLNLFFDRDVAPSAADVTAVRGMADVATIGILQERMLSETTLARDQLQHALDSRVLIEQAKGIIARSDDVDMEEAFRRLRERARAGRARISETARELIARTLGQSDGDGHITP